jgi:two-component system cell cycle response regulator
MTSRHNRLSLRSRLMLWQIAVLAPLLLAMLLHHQYLMPKFTQPLTEIAKEITHEVLQVKNLQLTLHMSAMPVNDYLIHGNPREITAFATQRQRVDQGFNMTRNAPFGENHERQLVESAWREWEQAKGLAGELLGITDPVGKPDLGAKMERFDRSIDNASAKLEELYNLAYHEIKEAQAEAHAAHLKSNWVSLVALVLAIILSLLLGSALAHTIVFGLTSLRTSATQVAAGHFDQQVRAGGIHELEELANAFNSMAAKLQAHDAVLQDLAIRDALTGLENRRAFDTRLHEELQRAERYEHSLSLLMLDIDHFKQVNDTYGHQSGDMVLRRLASIIKDTMRPMDQVFRYGGEEFVLVVPETDMHGACSLAERIREAVASAPFPLTGHEDIHITISIGVATSTQETNACEALVSAADAALYEAKQTGRNRVCCNKNRR